MIRPLTFVALLALSACTARVVDEAALGGPGTVGNVASVQPIQYDNEGNPIPYTDAIDPITGLPIQRGVGVAIDGNTQLAAGEIQDNPNEIVLSSYSQEQQKIDRERYAAQIAAIAAQRQEVSVSAVPEASTVSAAAFARSTTHAVGTKIYERNGTRGSCSRYASGVEAQRAFLEAGGPINDKLGLDRDGDGFACNFDPTIYRTLRY